MRSLLGKIKAILQFLVKAIQGLLLVVFLTILYFFGFGVTVLFMLFFKRRALNERYNLRASFWDRAEGYEADINSSISQS
jgi:cytochrome c biogenesis protein CcdA